MAPEKFHGRTPRCQLYQPRRPTKDFRDPRRHSESEASDNSAKLALSWRVRGAQTAAELRACAYLRAASFYHYQEDRSELAKRAHRRMKADAEWQSLEAKVAGREVGWESIRVVPLLVTVQDVEGDAACERIREGMPDLSATLPASGTARPAELAVGTLDINYGAVLPAEDLRPRARPGRSWRAAYLSNVCVLAAARRLGIATKLVDHTARVAHDEGVEKLYVHVEANNTGALKLYQACEFSVEVEETAEAARKRQHERRLLLARMMP